MSIADPLELFRTVNALADAEDYLAVAHLCDPVSLRAFHRNEIARLVDPPTFREWTVDDMLRHQPEMPREVAEYNMVQQRKHAAERNTIADELPGIDTPAALIAASADAVFAAHLAAVSPRAMYRRARAAAQAHGKTAKEAQSPDLPDVADLPSHMNLIAIGFVDDGSPIGRIVYRHDFPKMEQLQAMARGPRDRATFDNHRRRLAALPEDERTLQLELEGREHVMVSKCRRQADGGWLMLAEHGLLWANSMFGFSTDEDDEDDSAEL